MNSKNDEVIETGGRELPEVYVDDLLMSIKYFTDEHEVHLKIKDQAVCDACENKPCITFCPVGAYQKSDDGIIIIAFQSCIECGTCRFMCPPNNVEWKLPRGGFGVAYKFG